MVRSAPAKERKPSFALIHQNVSPIAVSHFAQAETVTAAIEFFGSVVLGPAAAILVGWMNCARKRRQRNRGHILIEWSRRNERSSWALVAEI
jgi:hypothetical protein